MKRSRRTGSVKGVGDARASLSLGAARAADRTSVAFARWAPLFVTLVVIALGILVRVRLAGVPLERDEGEYGYAGRLILQGIPPYKLAYNMKFPGTYYTYALIMRLFGQSPRGIHLGLALVNASTAWLVFAIGRRLLGSLPAAVASTSFTFLSLDRWIMGVFAHATHFVLLPAMAGFALLLHTLELSAQRVPSRLDVRGQPNLAEAAAPSKSSASSWAPSLKMLAAGALLGSAVLMKQHAALFLPLAVVMIVWTAWRRGASRPTVVPGTAIGGSGEGTAPPRASDASRRSTLERGPRGGSRDGPTPVPAETRERVFSSSKVVISQTIMLTIGALLPLALVCLVFFLQGVLGKFWFWTFQYAHEYISQVPFDQALPQLVAGLKEVTRANLVLWLIAGAGIATLWLGRWDTRARVFLTGLISVSFLALCPGFYFREHYFILLLPALALLIGVCLTGAGRIVGRIIGGGGIATGATVVLCGALLGSLVYAQRNYLFAMDVRLLSRTRYGSNPFIESVEIAKYIRERTADTDRIAVLGSEPEVYFYAQRISATGYIYVYPLMEPQRYAPRMQEEMMSEIEAAHPKYVVFTPIGASWLPHPGSDRKILTWADRYLKDCYEEVGIADIAKRDVTRYVWDADVPAYRPVSKNIVYTFRRKSDAPCSAPHG